MASDMSKPFLTSTWAKYPRLGAALKGAIAWLAVREIIPGVLATWLIQRLGLRAA